jgi:hypothetical protein
VDCGPIEIEWTLRNGKPYPLDADIFEDDRTSDPYKFRVKEFTDPNKQKNYDLYYTARFTDYSDIDRPR